MTWTLHAPSTSTFEQYKSLAPGEPWYSNKFVDGGKTTAEAFQDYRQRGFVEMIEKHHSKIYSIGMHEFGVNEDGTIYNMGYGGTAWHQKVLTPYTDVTQADIALPVKLSLRYLMHTYPDIKWSIQALCTTNSSGNRVEPVLDNTNGAQDTFLAELKQIAAKYLKYGYPIQQIEIDFEKTTTRSGEDVKFKNMLVRVKNEVCIPLGLELRVNLFAMTGEYNPSYYGWHNYSTLASGLDSNGKQAIDEFQLMTYDFSWGGSAPGPSTPLWWLENVLKHVKNVLPPEKTFIGNAGYGRRWPLSERRLGVTLDYKQLMQAQNGMYVHNDGETALDGNFYFRDQDFIPVCGFNDEESDYQVTYLHVYDMFKAPMGIPGTYNGFQNIEIPSDYATNYSKTQKPIFTGIQVVENQATLVGNAKATGFTVTISDGIPPNTFNFYVASKARWVYDNSTQSCVLDQGNNGIDGEVLYDIIIPFAGTFRLIAVVAFPFFGSDKIPITINGQPYVIGEGIPEWYPFITNPSWHYWDCGEWNLTDHNTIRVGISNGAWVGGFVVCEDFDQNLSGGKIHFPANLQKMKKRGPKLPNGNSEIIDAQFPDEMIITGELLRRPPRPVIIWEDMFGPHLKGAGFTTETDLTIFPYYLKSTSASYTPGSGPTPYAVGGTTYCIDNVRSAGFSKGNWMVLDDGSDAAHTWANLTTDYGQIVLNKRFASNIQVELDCRVNTSNTNAKYGVRLISEAGNHGQGWIVRLNFETKQVEWIDLQNPENNQYANMSASLSNGVGGRYTLVVQRINGSIRVTVGSNLYLNISVSLPSEIAYGAYGMDCTMKVYRLTVSSLDRWEPMEKLTIEVDGQKYPYGEVTRTVNYDEYGYLIYTGLPEDITEIEVTPEDWSLDYQNLPIVQIPSWVGPKQVTVEMKDPGIWLRNIYIGDAEGYSVAYNSDKVGFIRTSQMVLDYGCKGIALWTLGQEDPMIFSYINTS